MDKIVSLSRADYKDIFFIGIAGSGMSAIAQFLVGSGIKVSGSDRFFSTDQKNVSNGSVNNKMMIP